MSTRSDTKIKGERPYTRIVRGCSSVERGTLGIYLSMLTFGHNFFRRRLTSQIQWEHHNVQFGDSQTSDCTYEELNSEPSCLSPLTFRCLRACILCCVIIGKSTPRRVGVCRQDCFICLVSVIKHETANKTEKLTSLSYSPSNIHKDDQQISMVLRERRRWLG
jgi:hypothetical protein